MKVLIFVILAIIYLLLVLFILGLLHLGRREPPRKEGDYPVYCAWCLKYGTLTIVNRSTVAGSHGICRMHARELLSVEVAR